MSLLIIVGASLSGCTCGDASKTTPVPSASVATTSVPASASASGRVPRATQPAPTPENDSVLTSDGFRIEASKWVGGDPKAPAVILVHRIGGSRGEWTPLIERIFPPKQPMNVVAFDLRGHGESTSFKGPRKGPGEETKVAWQSFDNAAYANMDEDMAAITTSMEKQGPPSAWILVGSSLGSTLIIRHAAKREGDVEGLALVSPGAGIRGMDAYRPFGAVLTRPNLLMAGTLDSISFEPVRLMARMSKTSTLLTYEERGHSAQFLGEARWEMWDDLAQWVETRVRESTSPQTTPSAAPPASAGAVPGRP